MSEDGTVEIEGRKMRYIDPLTDWGFKRLFGSEMNKEILLGFLQDLFPEKDIRDISYLGNENAGATSGDRKAVFDVSCRTEKGEEFIVEMQKAPQEYFRDRALYYSTFPLQRQAPKGDWDFRLTPVYMVGILNFGLVHNVRDELREKVREMRVFRYELTETTLGERMTDNLAFVFLELERFGKSEDGLETMLDKWMYVLKNLSRLTERPVELQERIFRRLFEAARIAAFTREELDEYTNDMMTENDRRNAIDYARKQGLEEGLAKGRAAGLTEGHTKGRAEGLAEGHTKGLTEGLAKGEKAGKLSVAQKMLAAGLDPKMVSEMTGLPEPEIQGL